MKPLEGIRILDLSHMLPGPFCTMLLADMGAEVIKVENPKGGDSFRGRVPHLKNEGTAFLMLNRNKNSVIVDLKDEEGREFFMRLAESADVILEQFKPGTTEKLGIGYEAVSKRNPSIIYCSLSGYGQSGPYVDMPGHDVNYLSLSGVLDTIGQEGQTPAIPGIQIADIGGGAQWTLAAIMFALFARQKDGKGRYLDVAMTRCVVPWMSLYLSQYAADGTVPERGTTKAGGHFACYNIYETSDGRYVTIGAAEPKFFAKFCDIVGKPHLSKTQYDEGPNRVAAIEELRQMFKENTQQHWADLLMNENVCFTPVRSFDEVISDEGITANGLVGAYEHPVEGSVVNIGFPVDIPGVELSDVKPAPGYGADTKRYLEMAGYDAAYVKEYLDGLPANAVLA